MGSESQEQVIPILELSKEIERGSEEWIELSKRVREACEDYGCFEVIYEQISKELKDEVFSLTKQIFELPLEIKKKNTNSDPYMAYSAPNSRLPLVESSAIQDASNYDSIKSFAHLMYSHDPLSQHHFCKTFNTMVNLLDDLHQTIKNLIVDSYNLGNKEDTIATMATQTLVRMMKYKAPPPGQEDILGAYAHTDKPLCTLVCEDDESSGLELATKNGNQWNLWSPTHPNSFIFNIGDPLMAWSNGRLHAMKHRVAMRKGKGRHSIGAFLFPIEGTIIKPEEELIDENHPKMFKEFDHSEYLKFCNTMDPTVDPEQLVYKFAGI